MDARVLLQQLLRNPHTSRTLLTLATRPQSRTFALLSPQQPHARHLSLPTILRPSFWKSMLPRPLRSDQARSSGSETPKREWNPATPYIILALLVGSQAIQILWLKQERALETRRAEAKIGLLREVVERVQRGEAVDVDGVLGTGVEGRESEWAGLLQQIEDEDLLFQSSEEKRKIKEAARIQEQKEAAQDQPKDVQDTREEPKLKVESLGEAKFY